MSDHFMDRYNPCPGDVCRLFKATGVCCPPDSCDLATGVRVMPKSAKPIIHPRSDSPPEVFRASHEAICEKCGREYIRHQRHWYTDDPQTDQFILMLWETCDGRKWKL